MLTTKFYSDCSAAIAWRHRIFASYWSTLLLSVVQLSTLTASKLKYILPISFLAFLHQPCKRIDRRSGRKKCSCYQVTPFTATRVILCRLSSPTRLFCIDSMLGLRYSALSEVFWEAVDTVVETKPHLLESLLVSLLFKHATHHAHGIHDKGAPRNNWVCFIDYTKMKMCRPGGQAEMQRCCYSAHGRFHCPI